MDRAEGSIGLACLLLVVIFAASGSDAVATVDASDPWSFSSTNKIPSK